MLVREALQKAGADHQMEGFTERISDMLKEGGLFEITSSSRAQLITMVSAWVDERNARPGGYSAHRNRSEARAIATWLNSLAN